MIEFEELRKTLGRAEALRGLSFRMEPGELGLLLGPNGSGKTTALRIAVGSLAEDGGSIRAAGVSLSPEERRRRFAYLPQAVAFQPRLSARQLLRFYARALGLSSDGIEPALQQWGLFAHAEKPSGALSGGLRQRLGLAAISLRKVDALLLDEPDISLDAEWRERMQEWLREQSRAGRAALVATHLLAEWEGRADRAILCQAGRVERELDPGKLKSEGAAALRESGSMAVQP